MAQKAPYTLALPPAAIAVGSVDPNLQHSTFSNYGSQINIWAPGRDILATKRDGGYGLVSGTSFAAPYVAGVEAVDIALGKELYKKNEIVWLGEQVSATNTPSATETSIEPTAHRRRRANSGKGGNISAQISVGSCAIGTGCSC